MLRLISGRPDITHQAIQLHCWYWMQADFEHQVKLERQLNADLQRQHEQLTQAKVGYAARPSQKPVYLCSVAALLL